MGSASGLQMAMLRPKHGVYDWTDWQGMMMLTLG